MESLNDIGMSEDTDKAALTKRGSHHYADLYDVLFRHWRGKTINVLEVGVDKGGSIRMWRKYFPNSHVTAIDASGAVTFEDDPHVWFIHGDYRDESTFRGLSLGAFDLMIDDADHQVESQKLFLQRYSPMLKPNGILIIEDVLTKEGALEIKKHLPEGFSCAIVQMNEGNSIIDSRLFIAYRNS